VPSPPPGGRFLSQYGARVHQPSASSTNPAGAAIVNAAGPIRQIAQDAAPAARRYLVVAPGEPGAPGAPVRVQTPQCGGISSTFRQKRFKLSSPPAVDIQMVGSDMSSWPAKVSVFV
jgi:hypothetical protein